MNYSSYIYIQPFFFYEFHGMSELCTSPFHLTLGGLKKQLLCSRDLFSTNKMDMTGALKKSIGIAFGLDSMDTGSRPAGSAS